MYANRADVVSLLLAHDVDPEAVDRVCQAILTSPVLANFSLIPTHLDLLLSLTAMHYVDENCGPEAEPGTMDNINVALRLWQLCVLKQFQRHAHCVPLCYVFVYTSCVGRACNQMGTHLLCVCDL